MLPTSSVLLRFHIFAGTQSSEHPLGGLGSTRPAWPSAVPLCIFCSMPSVDTSSAVKDGGKVDGGNWWADVRPAMRVSHQRLVGFFATEGTSGLHGLIKRGAHTLWMLTLMSIDPPNAPTNPETPAVFTPGNTSVFLIQESVCLSLNLCATNFPFSFSYAASSSGSHHAVLRASIAYMSCALQVGIPRRKVEHFPLGNSHHRKRPAS